MNKGFLYEKRIFDIMKQNNLVSEKFINQQPAGCDNTRPDMVLVINNQDVNFEIKKSLKSQAGGTSIRYANNDFEFVKPISGVPEDNVYELLRSKEKDILKFLDHNSVDKIPFTTTKSMWNSSVKKGLLKPINSSIECDMSFIENHYSQKNTNYIQIGNHGLYYMTEDFLNLGVPKLSGKMKLEIRLTRGGSFLNKNKIRVCHASLRAQARITNIVKSKFNLEELQTINFLKNKIA